MKRSLDEVSQGETVQVHSIEGDMAMRSRLCSLGFTPGATVRRCNCALSGGCCQVVVREASLVLDSVTASAITCCTGDTEKR